MTKIPATVNRFTAAPIGSRKKRKVAGYARVSTDHEEQLTSYEAQLDYYTNYIKEHDDWEFAGMYSDEGISATSTAHRAGFNQMVEDALGGAIDLIITKSVSRFARNTVDSLSTIRKLKEHGTECYFEKENIWTFDSKGELLITIMSSLAQEESRSISENVTWGQRKRFADGKVSVPYSRFLGYDKGPDGNLVVNKEQAETVRLIYGLFLSGLSYAGIAKELMKKGIKTAAGREKWTVNGVQGVLTNEKYKGDALLQKCFTVDYLTKKQKKNEGEVPQYYVEDNHEAIIPREQFDLVQAEIARRSSMRGRYSGVSIFSSRIRCAECGCWYGSKVWHSTDKYRKVVWNCNGKTKKKSGCRTPHVEEEQVKRAFVDALNSFTDDRAEIIANVREELRRLTDTTALEEQKRTLMDEMNVVAEMTNDLIAENARVAQDQEEYQKRYDALVARYETAEKKHDAIDERIRDQGARHKLMAHFADTLESMPSPVTEFSEAAWGALADHVTVYVDGSIGVTLKNGMEIKG